MNRSFIVVFISLLIGLGPAGIDGFAPIVATIADDYQLSAINVQLGITAFVIAMGLGQIFIGPISDRFGRTTPLYAGMIAYIVGSLICVIAPNLSILLIGRTLQGFGASCGQIIARAIMRDLYSGRDLARITSDTTAIMSIVVLLSPPLAFIVSVTFSWQGVFLILGIYAFIMLLVAKFKYQETLEEFDTKILQPRKIMNAILRISLHPQSRSFMIVLVVGGMAMFSYVVSAPNVYKVSFQTTGITFAILYAVIGLGVIIGQVINRYLINIIGTLSTIIVTLGIACLAVSTGLIFALAGQMNVYGYTLVIILFAMGFMMMVANATSLVMDPHGKIAGFAASLVGSLTFMLGSIIGTIVAYLAQGSAAIVLASMLLWLLISLGFSIHWLYKARYKYTQILG